MKKKEEKSFGCIYEGYETEEGNTLSGAVTLEKGDTVFETEKDFLDFLARELKTWISRGLQENKNRQFVLVLNFEES